MEITYQYSDLEKRKVKENIEKNFGKISELILLTKEQRIVPIYYNLVLIKKKTHQILMTFGLGSFISHNEDHQNSERSEIYFELPLDWHFSTTSDQWAIQYIINIVKLSYERHHMLSWYQVFTCVNPITNTDKIGVFLDVPSYGDCSVKVDVGQSFNISYYVIILITDREVDYIKRFGLKGINELSKIFDRPMNRLTEINRKSFI
ncbi:suppressor of fused domain protein [Ureaplasma canigenitalium]|uniref:suppressor of fused domain protein n=1 Tax=Ureaplasma canigenitalium TaxID=42092 RepID=UPI00068A3D80|nr:suppressor of fused domain protein [Ureaplasma canigenitalium]